jgi:hypothetical protein
MVVSMAPGLSNLLVYEGMNADDILNQMATDNLAKQLSSSWSWGVSPDLVADQIFEEFVAQGQTFFQSSGDVGAYVGSIAAPQDDPYVTVVGGTSLMTAGPPKITWLSESVWNWQDTGQGLSASGGGVSAVYPIPPWQSNVDMGLNGGSAAARNFPDVAMVADNIWVVYGDGQSETTGGTSCACPLWAGFNALINEQAQSAGAPPVGFLNPALYRIGLSTNYTLDFHDVTTGSNTNQYSPDEYYAATGFDLCTGWGTPVGQRLITALAIPDALVISPLSGWSSSGPVGGPFTLASQSLCLTNVGTAPVSWEGQCDSPWLNLSTNHGRLLPAGTSEVVRVTLNPAAAALPAGVYSANACFTNLDTGFVQSRPCSLRVGQTLVDNGGFETGDFSAWTLKGDLADDFVAQVTNCPYCVHSGEYGAKLGQEALPLGTLSQAIPTKPDQSYFLSLWLNSSAPQPPINDNSPNEFSVSWGGATLFDETNIPAIGWTNLFFTVTASSNSTVLEFGFRDDPWALGLDDIIVVPASPLLLQAIMTTNGAIQLNWTAIPGFTYDVEYNGDLGTTNWQDLSGNVTATNTVMSVSDDPQADFQRFYRVLLVE